jgi:transmembrane sensor
MIMKAPHFKSAAKLTQNLDPAILEEAADWLVRRRAGFGPGEELRFQAWISAEPQCGAALAELEKTWDTISYPGKVGQQERARHQLLTFRRSRRRRSIMAAASIGFAAVAALMIGLFRPFSTTLGSPHRIAMVTIRPDRQLLSDGSAVERNAQTDIEIDYTSQERRIRLIRGEALFSVVSDPSRPFLVTAGTVETRAVGTEFSVRCAPAGVDVLVIEGEVAVSNIAFTTGAETGSPQSSHSPMKPVYVAAGKHIVMPVDLPQLMMPQIKVMRSEEIIAALAWRGKRIEFTRTPLSQVAKIFNRENELQLSIEDKATRELQITGVFWADDPEGLVRLLQSGFQIKAQRSDAHIHLALHH